MVDHYHILGVKPNASAADIKSAYRRLARASHPDVNGGSPEAAREFALIALAYRTLSDAQERFAYDAQRKKLNNASSSVLHSDNLHARRARRVAAQARWDRAVDRWLEAERIETFARTQAVFTTVTLFLSTFMVALLKPRFWQSFDSFWGRTIVVTLFLIGLWHLAIRLRDCFDRYTYQPKFIQDSIMRGEEPTGKPFTRLTAYAFLVFGYVTSIAIGLYMGGHVHYVVQDMAFFFDQSLRPDLLFYPPIAVLIVDTMHSVASRIDA
ncbi:MAG: J domain-containing protein [Pyrinomonadaceae bacterium]